MVAPTRGFQALVTHADNVAQTLKASQPLTKYYVQQIVLQNAPASVATTWALRDGTVEIFKINLPAAQVLPVIVPLSMPLQTSIGNALQAICGTTGSTVYANVQGFAGA